MADDLVIRQARPSEHAALEALQWRASLIWEDDRPHLLAHPDAIELPMTQILDGRAFVAERGGEIQGFCVVLRRTPVEAELDGLFVEPCAMRAGLGARLVAQAEAFARSDGALSLFVIASANAEAFYRRCGFDPVGQAKTRFGWAPTMRKLLTR